MCSWNDFWLLLYLFVCSLCFPLRKVMFIILLVNTSNKSERDLRKWLIGRQDETQEMRFILSLKYQTKPLSAEKLLWLITEKLQNLCSNLQELLWTTGLNSYKSSFASKLVLYTAQQTCHFFQKSKSTRVIVFNYSFWKSFQVTIVWWKNKTIS